MHYYSGTYLVTNPSTTLDASARILHTLIQSIETAFPTATRAAPWSLHYRLFRDMAPPSHSSTIDPEGKPQPFAHSYQHFLQHSHLAPDRMFICLQPASGHSSVTSVPQQQQDAHVWTTRQYMAALWSPRLTLFVQHGLTYTGGSFTIHLGELRSTRETSQSGALQSPGIVISISTLLGAANDTVDSTTAGQPAVPSAESDSQLAESDFQFAETAIRGCWAMLHQGRNPGPSPIREVMMTPTLTTHKGREREQEQEAAVRMWCDALRLRA